jgi:diguanylate cyclase (GGDEF)-like protein/PAS domain S-box-containing protein
MVATERRTRLLLIEAKDCDAQRFGAVLEVAAPATFEVVRVTTLADAMSYLETKTADCALIDLVLPDAEGLDIVAALADLAPAVALVILTDREEDEVGLATIESGACDYIPKSALEAKLLMRAIRYAILRKRAETSLAEAQRIAHVGSWELDLETTGANWTRELSRLFGFAPNEKPTYEALIERTHPDDRQSTIAAVQATLEDLSPFVVDHRILLPDGTVRWIRGRGRVELGADGRPRRLLGTAQDITEQKTAEDALQYQAFHDPLSGLPNRQLFLDRLGQTLKRLGRQPSLVAVIYLNIDRFKMINASLGHTSGDRLLLTMAARLATAMRPGDTLARIGGDEFVMLCEGLSAEAEAVGIADRICQAVAEPLVFDGGDLVLTVSAGIALSTSSSDDPPSILRDADAAMDRAKAEGRGHSVVFAETMRTTAVGRLDTEIGLRQSIASGDIRVHYQTIVTLADGQIIGHEALVRWRHPTRGLLGPDQFISVAEETGLIVPLGAWVLREACRQAKQFQARDPAWSRLTMSVNLSGAQLGQADLIELTASALHDAGLRAEYLQLEMTESVLMDDAPTTTTILKTLKGLGVRLGVDDFGTGYSSLAYLRRFPVDVLKIDRSFVNGLGKDLEDSAVAAAVVSLCDTLGLTTIAEGVETRLQRDCLIGLGCLRAQGYLFARPVSPSECEKALDDALDDTRVAATSPLRHAASRGPW